MTTNPIEHAAMEIDDKGEETRRRRAAEYGAEALTAIRRMADERKQRRLGSEATEGIIESIA